MAAMEMEMGGWLMMRRAEGDRLGCVNGDDAGEDWRDGRGTRGSL